MPHAPIETGRLVLRPIERSDAGPLLALIDNWNVVRWLAVVPWPYAMADMMFFIDEIAGPRSDTRHPIYTILLDGAPIGAGECRVDAEGLGGETERGTELGYWVGEPYWGRGLGTEAVSAIVARTFEDEGVDVIRSGVFEGNDASLAIQLKLGFEVTGTAMTHCLARGRDLPLVRTRLSRVRFRSYRR